MFVISGSIVFVRETNVVEEVASSCCRLLQQGDVFCYLIAPFVDNVCSFKVSVCVSVCVVSEF